MAIYRKLTNTVAQDLIVKGNTSNRFGGRVGGISKIILTNVHGSVEPTVTVFLDDGALNQFTLSKAVIPKNTTLVLTDNLSFDGAVYGLKAQASDTGEIHIVVK